MHNSRATRAADLGDLWEMGQESMSESAGGPACSWMHRQLGWLVQDHQIVILVQDDQVSGLGLHPFVQLTIQGRVVDLFTGTQRVRSLRGLSVDLNPTGANPLLNLVSGKFQLLGEKTVQPQTRGFRGHLDEAIACHAGEQNLDVRFNPRTG
jgi:hypothetical protein